MAVMKARRMSTAKGTASVASARINARAELRIWTEAKIRYSALAMTMPGTSWTTSSTLRSVLPPGERSCASA